MPFKTGLGTAGQLGAATLAWGVKVSMPFKTGLGTAGFFQQYPEEVEKRKFQCPLRRAWVLRMHQGCGREG